MPRGSFVIWVLMDLLLRCNYSIYTLDSYSGWLHESGIQGSEMGNQPDNADKDENEDKNEDNGVTDAINLMDHLECIS